MSSSSSMPDHKCSNPGNCAAHKLHDLLNKFTSDEDAHKDSRACMEMLKQSSKQHVSADKKMELLNAAITLLHKDSVVWTDKPKAEAELVRVFHYAREMRYARTLADLQVHVNAAHAEGLLTPCTATVRSQRYGRTALVQVVGQYTIELMTTK